MDKYLSDVKRILRRVAKMKYNRFAGTYSMAQKNPINAFPSEAKKSLSEQSLPVFSPKLPLKPFYETLFYARFSIPFRFLNYDGTIREKITLAHGFRV